MRVETSNADNEYLKENADKLKEDEENYIDAQLRELDDDIEDETEKNLMAAKFRLDCISTSF
jgi:hypothetical protein